MREEGDKGKHGGNLKGQRRVEVAGRRAVCLREEDKGVQRVKYCLPKSTDRFLNYSKESGLLCAMLDAVLSYLAVCS